MMSQVLFINILFVFLFFCTLITPTCSLFSLSSQSPEEEKYLKFHKCRDTGEAYGAAYFITKTHLIQSKVHKYNLSWVNCEMGSFVMMNQRLNPRSIRKENLTGVVIQSLDVLDFSVIHLSAYERLQRRWKLKLFRGRKKTWAQQESVDEVLKNATKYLRASINQRSDGVQDAFSEFNRTVAIMPFLGSSNGAGHSVLSNRYLYLKACFWSIFAYIPNVVAVVQSDKDYEYCKTKSGLPFYDVIFARGLPKVASLPIATSRLVRQRLLNGTYDFDYVYFTESDQILLLREARQMINILRMYPRYVLVPHRLMPYPETIVKRVLQRSPVYSADRFHGWTNISCCLERQNCMDGRRKTWQPVKSPNVSVVYAAGFNVPLGNSNFLKEQYHYCQMMPTRTMYCP